MAEKRFGESLGNPVAFYACALVVLWAVGHGGAVAMAQASHSGDAGTSAAAPAANPVEELRRTFTLSGKPVPPEVFRDLGDGDLADSLSAVVAIDVQAAIGSNRYADRIGQDGAWVVQTREADRTHSLGEVTAYRYIGATPNGLLVAVASYNSGGSGTFFTLHILDATSTRAFDLEGNVYKRVTVTAVRSIPLGDRWDGAVAISGGAVMITTNQPASRGGTARPSTISVDAMRP